MKLPEITLARFVETEQLIQEQEGWAAQARVGLLHYAGLSEEAQAKMPMDDVFTHLAKVQQQRAAIYKAERQDVLEIDGQMLRADHNILDWPVPRYADMETYLQVYSTPRLFVPLASVVYWPEGQPYDTQAGIARQKGLMAKPAHQVIPSLLFFCKAVASSASDSPTFSGPKPAATERPA